MYHTRPIMTNLIGKEDGRDRTDKGTQVAEDAYNGHHNWQHKVVWYIGHHMGSHHGLGCWLLCHNNDIRLQMKAYKNHNYTILY